MRIQHNIMAMNAYRNYSNNTSALSKNLEKLSSGYKINRAGDDAAGLAISEKMRAQITGLEAAQKNVKDGISLVNTAEGALQEVQNMLNRMVYLAQESANGTFDNEVDRKALQSEVDQLNEEIDRIADSANFNGIKLLDGSLSSTGGVGGAGAPTVGGLDTETQAATKGSFVTAAVSKFSGAFGDGKQIELTVNYADANGAEKAATLTVTAHVDGTNAWLETEGGEKITLSASDAATATEVGDAFVAAAKENADLANNFKISNASGALTFGARNAGAATKVGSVVAGYSDGSAADTIAASSVATVAVTATKGADAYEYFDFKDMEAGEVFTVNGQSFAFVTGPEQAAELGSNVNCVKLAASSGNPAAADVTEMVKVIQGKTGAMGVEANGTTINFKSDTTAGAKGGGLTLQIGDSSDRYNQLTVNVKDMHAKAMGVAGINIATQAGAQAAVDVIKQAINYVSDVRGNLGAISNRLDHTANNLSVMRENIQDAESAIRDTDVAEEMMSYTKNNILVQSAQAMLAQANQVPQGVLQLLQ